MTKHRSDQAKVFEIAELLGLKAETSVNNTWIVLKTKEGFYLGTMSPAAWLDHLRHCVAAAKRS